MSNVLLADSDQKALAEMECVIKINNPAVYVISVSDPQQLLLGCDVAKPDLVFANSEMPGFFAVHIISALKWNCMKVGKINLQQEDGSVKLFFMFYKAIEYGYIDDCTFDVPKINFTELYNTVIKQKQVVENYDMTKRLKNFFTKIGIYPNLIGYDYLLRAVSLAGKCPQYVKKLNRNLYPIIASDYNTSPCRVERGIRNAIDVAYNKGKMSFFLNNLTGDEIFKKYERPTNSKFIAFIVDKIKYGEI